MTYTIKIFGVATALALAMTAAYASSRDRSEAAEARPVAASARLVVPGALSPAGALNCRKLEAVCLSESVCIAGGGTAAPGVGGCPSGTVCCFGI